MRRNKRILGAVLVSSIFMVACTKADKDTTDLQKETTLASDIKDTIEDVSEAETDSKADTESSTESGSETNVAENETDAIVDPVIDGFYNCVDSEESRMRIDFEVKRVENGYVALFYSQYSDMDTYGTGQLLHGEQMADTVFQFTAPDENYTITWDGADKLVVDGTWFSGTYERGKNDGYGEPEYMIPDIPSYEADQNVEPGIEIDTTLAHAIRMELGYDENAMLTYSDLDSITYLAPFNYTMTSIKGISQLKNLQEVHIGNSYITDISELTKLEAIRFIDVNNCYITEIPDFSGCSNLESLYLGGNLIEDVSPLADIKSLKYVDLNCNRIRSIAPLKDVTNLEMLCIESNCILDFKTIKDSGALLQAYDYGAQGTYEMALTLENRVKEIVASFPTGLSELELEKVIYQYIKDNMYFDDGLRDGAPYGYQGIMEGNGVCGDYAEAFALLANHAGLEAYECRSDTHAWNIVKIDGKYYHCDALWDEDVTEWLHFNKSTGYIYNLQDHMHDLRKYPICDVSMSVLEYCNYFMDESNGQS